MPDQQQPPKTPNAKAPAIIAAAVLVAAPLAATYEGYRGRAYYDPAHILTVCYGETENVDPSKIYSKDECVVKLRKRMSEDYAPRLAKCMPELINEKRVKVFGALLDASYNAGWSAVCKSRMAQSIHAGRWADACIGFNGWFVTARDRKSGKRIALPGLVRRRQSEAALCGEGIK
jgi:lysozyme